MADTVNYASQVLENIKMQNEELFETEKDSRDRKRTGDPATEYMIDFVEGLGLDTVFTRQKRYEEKFLGIFPKAGRCDFGSLGICCRQCLMGPCRIWHKDVSFALRVNAPSQTKGTCGATADTIVARNWLEYHNRGCAAHSTVAKDTAETLLKTARGQASFQIKDVAKLKGIAAKLGIETENRTKEDLAEEVALVAITDIIGKPEGEHVKDGMRFANGFLPANLVSRLKELNIMPKACFEDVADADHQCVVGMMADPYYFIMQSLKLGVADLMALAITTELHDVLLGTPAPVETKIGLNVLKEKEVNIAVHGHIPMLCEKLVELSQEPEIQNKVKMVGAEGINFVGVCCTGAEVLQRHRIPLAGTNLQEDLLIATGAVDAFLMDVQCSYPSAHQMIEQFHTKLITTMKDARVPGADHIPFDVEKSDEWAKQALKVAIDNFTKRAKKIHMPPFPAEDAMAGFSVESIIGVLSKLDAENPLKPLIDNIVSGNIYGVCLVAGCTSPKLTSDQNYKDITSIMLKHNILCIGSGCAAAACGRGGMLKPDATEKYAGEKLAAVLLALGQAAGLPGPLPPIWHMGSCVDNSRAVSLSTALANTLGVEIKDLPIVVSAAEVVTEKTVVIGTGAVAIGLPVHVSVIPPVMGSPLVVKLLAEDMKNITGGHFIVEPDEEKAAYKLIDIIKERRKNLGLTV